MSQIRETACIHLWKVSFFTIFQLICKTEFLHRSIVKSGCLRGRSPSVFLPPFISFQYSTNELAEVDAD